MTDERRLHHRRSIRLRGWDYTSAGAYFITVGTHDRICLLGDILDGKMCVNAFGTVVADTWRWLASQYPYVVLDEWCVMPNHFHGILVLTGRGGSRTAPTIKPVGRLIGAFKTVSTKRINLLRQTPGAILWQRNYWEHIVRTEDEMDRIRAYIRDNPAMWAADSLNG